MTIDKAIAAVNSVKPHEYADDIVIGWLADAEQLIYSEVTEWHRRGVRPCFPPPVPPEDPLGQEGGETPELPAKPPAGPPERYTTETPGGTMLLVPDPYSELYVHYICAQIDYHNAETLRYANSMQMFEAALRQFANWYNRTHMPVQRSFVRI